MSLRWNTKTELLTRTVTVAAILWVALVIILNIIPRRGKGTTTSEKPQDFQYHLTTIELPDDLQSFGKVTKGDTIRADFLIRNVGKEILHIMDVNPDCTCTDFYIDDNEIVSGESTVLTLYVDTTNKYGQNQIYATITCNTEERYHFVKLSFEVIDLGI